MATSSLRGMKKLNHVKCVGNSPVLIIAGNSCVINTGLLMDCRTSRVLTWTSPVLIIAGNSCVINTGLLMDCRTSRVLTWTIEAHKSFKIFVYMTRLMVLCASRHILFAEAQQNKRFSLLLEILVYPVYLTHLHVNQYMALCHQM